MRNEVEHMPSPLLLGMTSVAAPHDSVPILLQWFQLHPDQATEFHSSKWHTFFSAQVRLCPAGRCRGPEQRRRPAEEATLVETMG